MDSTKNGVAVTDATASPEARVAARRALTATPPPPEVPAGWDIAPPDFIGVGTQRSGTTWWWTVLSSHLGIANISRQPKEGPDGEYAKMLKRELYEGKEIHFFDKYGQIEDIDPALYYRYFPRPQGSIAGEWTPRYMYDFWTPPMLHKVAPESKLLVLLRDPVDRFISGVRLTSNVAGMHGIQINAQEFVYHDQFGRGLYWNQLQNLLKYFPMDQVLILQYERCIADTEGEARRTFAFLGLDATNWRMPEETSRPVGFAGTTEPLLNVATRDALRRAYEPDISRLLTEFSEIDGSLWPTVTA